MITAEQTTVYRAPTAGRRFLTKSAAIHAEAVAIIKRKHPTEEGAWDERDADPGFHWTMMPRHEVLLRRMKRLVKRSMTQPPAGRAGS